MAAPLEDAELPGITIFAPTFPSFDAFSCAHDVTTRGSRAKFLVFILSVSNHRARCASRRRSGEFVGGSWKCADWNFGLDVPTVARRLLSKRAAAQERAELCSDDFQFRGDQWDFLFVAARIELRRMGAHYAGGFLLRAERKPVHHAYETAEKCEASAR